MTRRRLSVRQADSIGSSGIEVGRACSFNPMSRSQSLPGGRVMTLKWTSPESSMEPAPVF